MPRQPDPRIAQLEAELMQAYYGDSPWSDLPTGPGWYWYRVVPSIVVRGPARVRLIDGRLLGEIQVDGGGEQPVEYFNASGPDRSIGRSPWRPRRLPDAHVDPPGADDLPRLRHPAADLQPPDPAQEAHR